MQHLHLDSNQLSIPQKQTGKPENLRRKVKKNKSKDLKYQTLSTHSKKPSQSDPFYFGLLTQQQPKINQKNIGPWSRHQNPQNKHFASLSQKPSTSENNKFFQRLSRNSFYHNKRYYSSNLPQNHKQAKQNLKYSVRQKFISKVSIRNAIIYQQDDLTQNLPTIKSQIQTKKLKTRSIELKTATIQKRNLQSQPKSQRIKLKLIKNPATKSIQFQEQQNLFNFVSLYNDQQQKSKIFKNKNTYNSLKKLSFKEPFGIKFNGPSNEFSLTLLKSKTLLFEPLKTSSFLSKIIHAKIKQKI